MPDTKHTGTKGHQLNDTLGALSDTAIVLEETRRGRDRYIVECAELGASYRRIAEYAGISHQRVAQIIAKHSA